MGGSLSSPNQIKDVYKKLVFLDSGVLKYDDGSSDQTILTISTIVTETSTDTLTNKTISGSSNTLSNIANSSLTNNTITIDGQSTALGGSVTTTNTQLSTEAVQDIVGAMFSSNTETRITATYQDSDGTIDLVVDDLDTDTQLTTENVQDIVGGMFSSNTETLISVSYQDGDGTVDLVVDNDLSNYDNSSSGFLTAHPNISAASSSDNSGAVFIQDVTLDSNGHVTGLTTATASTLTTEEVQDIVGAMFTSNTETRISASYEDSDGTIDLVVDDMTANTQLSTEQVQDIVGGMFDSNTETRVSATYDDTSGKINVVVDDMTANTQLSTEQVQDIVGNMFTSNTETRITASYDDGDGTIDLVVDDLNTDTQLTTEQVQDIVGAMFNGNTETRGSLTYDDSDGTIDLVVDDMTADTNTQLSTEQVQDIVGAMFDSNTETRISASYQDGDGTIDLVVDDMTATGSVRTVTAGGNTLGSNETLAFTAGSNVTISESGGAVTIASTDTNTQLSTEQVQDIVGAMFNSNTETRITAEYQDSDGTIDLVVDDMTANDNTQLSTEQVQDIVGAMFTSTNTETRITATYQDSTGDIDLVVDDMTANDNTFRTVTAGGNTLGASETLAFTAGSNVTISESGGAVTIASTDTNTQLSTEQVQDIVGAMFDSNTETRISATYQDGDGTIDLVVDDMTANTQLTLNDEDDMASNSATAAASQQSIKAYVDAEVSGIVDSAPAALNTLNELAAALGDDDNFNNNVSSALGNRLRVDTASQGLNGTQQANAITNLGITATKAELNYVDGVTSAIQTQLDGKLSTSGTAANSTLLNNLGAGSFLRSDAADTASGVITFSNRVTSTGTDGFTIGNYSGYDRIVNNSNVFRFLTDGNAYANMQFATVTAGTWQGTAIANAYVADLPASKITSGTFDAARIPTIDISSKTNLSAGTNISLSGDTLNVDDAFIKNNANDTSSGTITAAGFTVSGSNALTLPASHYVGKIVMYSGGNEKIGTEANTLLFTADNHKFKDTAGHTNVTFNNAGQIAAVSLDISGDADIDGTLEADAITVNGTALPAVNQIIALDHTTDSLTVPASGDKVILIDASDSNNLKVANIPVNTNQLTTFTLTADSGSNQTIAHGNTLDIAGGTGISTAVGSTDTVTVTLGNHSANLLTSGTVDAARLPTIDISSKTNLSAGTNISLSGDTLNVDDAFLKNNADDTTSGTITAGGFTTTGTVTAGASNNNIRLRTVSNASKIGDTFAGNTDQSYIDFIINNSSNDPGYIMHETRSGEANEGVLHLCPSDDNADGDYVSIHGTNDADSLKLHTSGKIEGVSTLVATTLDISGNVDVDGTLETDALTINGTASVAFTSSDHSKLDGIASGATANTGDITNVIAGTNLTGGSTSGEATLNMATFSSHIAWNDGINITVAGESSFDVSGSGVFQIWDSGTGAPFIMCDVGARTEIGSAGSRGVLIHGEMEASSGDINGNLDVSGTITNATWNGDVIASAYLDSDTAHLSGTQTFSGAKTFSNMASFAMDGNTISGIDDSGEFTNNDSHIMTSAAVEDKILGYGYTTAAALGLGDLALVDDIAANRVTSGTLDAARIPTTFTTITGIRNSSLVVGRDFHNGIHFSTDNAIKVEVNDVQDEFRFASGGTFHADADIIAYSSTTASDKRLKENIESLPYGLDDVMKMKPVQFDWKKDKANGKERGHDIGVIAQEMEEVIPEVVKEYEGLQGKDNFKAVDYSKIVPVLIKSIQELKAEIEELKK